MTFARMVGSRPIRQSTLFHPPVIGVTIREYYEQRRLRVSNAPNYIQFPDFMRRLPTHIKVIHQSKHIR